MAFDANRILCMPRPIHLQPADLAGLSRLGIEGVHGVTDLVEDLHQAIARVPGLHRLAPERRIRGIPGIVYRSIHGVTGLVGGGLNLVFSQVAPRLNRPQSSPGRDNLLAILNGVLGDHLERTANPLAIDGALRRNGQPLGLDVDSLSAAFPDAQPRLMLTVHGLCMHDGHWYDIDAATRARAGLPEWLSRTLPCSIVDFHYNTGRRICANGRELSERLEALIRHWPVAVEELLVLGHSMGGLVARSAMHYGLVAGHSWPIKPAKLVFLGTPHHGSPVERIGHALDRALGMSRYSAPFVRLGKARSAGITDLRHGAILDTTAGPATPRLGPQTKCFCVAASLDGAADSRRSRLIGDGLVPVPSALGQHPDPALRLPLKPEHRYVATATGHVELLRCPTVAGRVRDWLCEA